MQFPKVLIEEAYIQLKILYSMFTESGLQHLIKTIPAHPAVKRHQILKKLIDSDVEYPDEIEVLREITSSIIDRELWATTSLNTEYWSFIPDENARQRIKETIRDSKQYSDTITEIFFWSWLCEQGISVELVEETGLPDLVVNRGKSDEVWIEVKSVPLGKNPDRLSEVISYANKQIKRAQHKGAGILYIKIERAIERVSLDDEVPNDIQPYIDQVEKILSSKFNKSIGRAIVSWDDFVVDTEPGQKITYRFRRRSELREHITPRSIIPLLKKVCTVNKNIEFNLKWPEEADVFSTGHGPRLSLGDFVVGPSFREFNASRDGIRPQHAIEAMSNPDAQLRYQFKLGDGEQYLVTRKVTASRIPYTMFLLARPLNDGRQEIGEAYRIYDDQDDNRKLHLHPMAAFETILERYSVPFLFPTPDGSAKVNLIRSARVPVKDASQKSIFSLFKLPKNVDALSGAARFRILNGSPLICELEWLWFLDQKRYSEDIRRYIR